MRRAVLTVLLGLSVVGALVYWLALGWLCWLALRGLWRLWWGP